ncbi:PAS domain S-box-containing protein [Humitalea rosea]|uniref:histidine kinase n=1 Tax=Humitalea rosea TaxID=990373 RepID=A0A2W7JER9_9PROT|nr:PAS-domain containing protein [Humitalea rosea]PZW50967.1 PAS domain S-box-containing protein [Humitalea rosea]
MTGVPPKALTPGASLPPVAGPARPDVLRLMLAHMQHGIALYDSEHRLVMANALAESLAGLAPGTMIPGRRLDEFFRQQAEQGVFGPGSEGEAGLRMRLQIDRSRPSRTLRRRADGRVMEAVSEPTPEGGFVITITDVTDRIRAEEAVAAKAAMLEAMVANLRHGIALFGPDRRLIVANRLIERFGHLAEGSLQPGLGLDTIIAMQVAAMASGDPAKDADLARAAIEADRSKPMRYTRSTAAGLVLDVASDPMPDGGFVITMSDISRLSAAENEARAQANLLGITLQNMRHGIALFGEDRRLLMLNQDARLNFGVSETTGRVGMKFDDLLQNQFEMGAYGTGPEAALRLAALKEHDRRLPLRSRRRDREGRTLDVISSPIEGGGFVISATDVSELEGARATAAAHAMTLQATLDNIRHGITLFDAKGDVLAFNTVFTRVLDIPPGAVRAGMSINSLVDLLEAQGDYGEGEVGRAYATRLRALDRSQSLRATRVRPNGMVLTMVSDPVPGGGFVVTFTDVTEDRRIRAELESARNAAEAANSAKSRFLATMTHELRTPLHAVIGFSEALMPEPPPARAKEFIASIHEAGQHLLSLIDNILDVTRAETAGLVMADYDVHVGALIDSAVRVIRAAADSGGITVVTNVPSSLPRLRADELRLRQILLNLLANAVKFTPAGGMVTVRAAVRDSGELCISVTDTGIGMSEEETPLIFQPFSQIDSSLSRRFPGSGLGLYLSRVLAEAHGGSLTVSSTAGVGTTMMVLLPAARLRPQGDDAGGAAS